MRYPDVTGTPYAVPTPTSAPREINPLAALLLPIQSDILDADEWLEQDATPTTIALAQAHASVAIAKALCLIAAIQGDQMSDPDLRGIYRRMHDE